MAVQIAPNGDTDYGAHILWAARDWTNEEMNRQVE
jgi:hypothetical protein